MAPVGPLHFVTRQASAWIMTLYFGDVVRHSCRVDRFRVPDVVRIRYPTLVTLLRLPYKVTNDVAQRRITIILVFAHSCCV